MKRLISIILAIALCGSLAASVACDKKPAPRGPTDVDYGNVTYIDYMQEPIFTFKYLDCFVRSSDEGDTFVAKTKDDNGVLMFEIGTVPQSRPYDAIKAYSNEEARDMLMIALGLVESQGAEREVTGLTFTPADDHIYMEMAVKSVFKQSGEIQGDYILKYILADGTVYTLHAFVPISCTEKYGTPFKDAVYHGEPADINTSTPNGHSPVHMEGYTFYNNEIVSFYYNDVYSVNQSETAALGMAQQGVGLIGYERGELKAGYTYDGIAIMGEAALADYLAGITGLSLTSLISVGSTQMDGYVRLDMAFDSVSDTASIHCIVTQFVLPQGVVYNVIAYLDTDTIAQTGLPVKDIAFDSEKSL